MRVAVFITVVGCLLICTPVVVSFYSLRPRPAERIAFDSARWKGAWKTSRCVRQQMVDDLLAKKLLEGLSRKQVVDLLGEPEEHSPCDEANCLVYFVGPYRGMGVDSEWLVVEFSDQGRVVEASLGAD